MRRMGSKLSASILLLLFGVCGARSQSSGSLPQRPLVLRAGRLLDVKSGNILTDQAIVIEGDKIVSVARASNIPHDASVINLPDATAAVSESCQGCRFGEVEDGYFRRKWSPIVDGSYFRAWDFLA